MPSQPSDPLALGVESVLTTDALTRRASRPPDFEAENRALLTLAQELAARPDGWPQKLVETVLKLCRADSAGLSSLKEETGTFREAAVGSFAESTGGFLPHELRPSGTRLQQDAVLLFAEPGRHFPALAGMEPPVVEMLLAPLHAAGQPVGMVWAVLHRRDRQFDAEDARRLASLARFASAGHQILQDITARRSTVEGLREREERCRLIIESARDYAILTTDPEGRITSWAPGAEAVLGWTAAEAIGQPLAITFTPEDRASGAPEQERATAREQGSAPDVRWHLRRDGARVFIDGVVRKLENGNGAVRGFLKIGRDVTGTKRAEEAVRASEAWFRTLADAVPQVIWTNIPEGRANYFNRRWYEYTGLSYEESAGPGWQVIVHPEDAPASVERWQQALAAGEAFDAEYRLRRHDGVYRWHLGRNVPLRDAAGHITGWFGSATDIEDLKQAQAAEREAQERFRVLVEGARDYAMFLQDPEGRVTFWSAGAERLFGYPEAEALGQPSGFIFTPEDRERGEPQKEMQHARTTGRAIDRRWHRRQDGSRFWTDGLLMRLDDDGGELRGFAKVTRDATEQKRAEEALHAALEAVARAKEELEQRVEARTRALRERTEELSQVSELRQELLRRLVSAQEQERGRIARDLHDDTGQQVAVLLLGLAALAESPAVLADPATRETLDRLQALATDLAQKSHRLAVTLRPTALDDLGLVTALTHYAGEWSHWSGVPVEVEATGLETRLPPELETTIYRVAQEALTNILRHAVEGGREPRATRVCLLLQRRPGEVITVIEDDGPGFDLEAALSLPPGQRRLGIFGMQERARLAGGTLSLESEPGGGTTVYLRVPLAARDQEDV